MKHPAIFSAFLSIALLSANTASATAQALTQDEVIETMMDKKITTKSFGVTVTLRFAGNGDLIAKSLIGDYTGKWKRGPENQICSTFDSGPAKGTQCNTYTKIGENRYRTSSGTAFTVHE